MKNECSKINRYRRFEQVFLKQYQLEPIEQNIKVEKYGINVRIQTIGNGQPILFIHGAPNSGSTWYQLVSLMKEHKCILLDRPGCGLSEEIPYNNLNDKRLSDLIVSVIDSVLNHFQIEKLNVVASSFGGYWALKYTLQRPGNVRKLIFEGCPAMVEGSIIPPFIKTMLVPVLKWLIPKLPTTKPVFKKIVTKLGHSYSLNNNLIPEVFIDWYIGLFNNTSTQKNDLSMVSKVVPGGKMLAEFMIPDNEIERILQPTLWLWGNDDPFGGIEVGSRLNSIMKNSSIINFDNSGHLPWIDKPEIHSIKIKKFIGKL